MSQTSNQLQANQADEQVNEQVDSSYQDAGASIAKLLDHLEQIIQGKRDVLQKVLACMLSGGHLLIEDLPGVGKTTLVKTLAKAIAACRYGRIQFTPDLLPYDITGVEVWRPDEHCFEFHPGPVFCNLLLADEINRATPKVQSALLEVMAEQQVTIGKETHILPGPFWVIATQNPIEMAGTYVLPKAQMDRFTMQLSLGYPDFEHEVTVVQSDPSHQKLPSLQAIIQQQDILELQKLCREVYCAPKLCEWAVRMAQTTRNHPSIHLGISTRGVLMWLASARGYALTQGRNYIIDQDLLELATAVLSHRLELRQQSDNAHAVIEKIIDEARQLLP